MPTKGLLHTVGGTRDGGVPGALADRLAGAALLGGRLTPAANLSDELIRRLATEIEEGRLAPGARLPTEQEIVAATGVSRTVVREAIAALRARGLIVTRQGAGAFVSADVQRRPFSIDRDKLQSLAEVLRVMELRLAIEVEAAGLAAQRRSASQLAEIQARLEAAASEMERGDSAVEADFAFHRAIFAAVDNPYFMRFLDLLGPEIIPRQSLGAGFGSRREQKAYLARIQAEHVAIHAAIGAQDAEAARRATRLHLGRSRDRYRRLAAAIDGRPPADRP